MKRLFIVFCSLFLSFNTFAGERSVMLKNKMVVHDEWNGDQLVENQGMIRFYFNEEIMQSDSITFRGVSFRDHLFFGDRKANKKTLRLLCQALLEGSKLKAIKTKSLLQMNGREIIVTYSKDLSSKLYEVYHFSKNGDMNAKFKIIDEFTCRK